MWTAYANSSLLEPVYTGTGTRTRVYVNAPLHVDAGPLATTSTVTNTASCKCTSRDIYNSMKAADSNT